MPIRTVDLSYAYGRKTALHGVTISFDQEATLLLGPNGAGKSTLLELMASFRRPTTGKREIDGVGSPGPHRSQIRRYREALAWLPQSFIPYPGVNVREHVALSGWLKGMPRRDAWRRAGEAVTAVDLQDKEKQSVKSLSGGQLRRLGIAGALVHDARVLLLDEPTAGLDMSQRARFHELVARLSHSRTIVVSSHDTEDALSRYDHVAVLNAGSLCFTGSPDAFLRDTDPTLPPGERWRAAYEALVGVAD